jgi:hypothetical protein
MVNVAVVTPGGSVVPPPPPDDDEQPAGMDSTKSGTARRGRERM